MEKLGVKETKDVIRASSAISVFLVKRLKDGVGVDDVMAVVSKVSSDEEFKKLMVEAMDGIKKIPAEIKDIDLSEGIELAGEAAKVVPKIISELSK